MHKNWLVLFAVLQTALIPAMGSAGVGSSGGGSVVQSPEGAARLLDFVVNGVPAPQCQAGDQFTPTEFERRLGFDFADMQDGSSYRRAVSVVERWRGSNPRLGALLLDSLKGIRFIYTFKPVRQSEGYYLPPAFESFRPRVVTSILYDRSSGAVLDGLVWNQLCREDQAGLLVHEAFRQMQLVFGADIADEQMQRATALMFSGARPRSLERAEDVGTALATAGSHGELIRRNTCQASSRLREALQQAGGRDLIERYLNPIALSACSPMPIGEREVDVIKWIVGQQAKIDVIIGSIMPSDTRVRPAAVELREGVLQSQFDGLLHIMGYGTRSFWAVDAETHEPGQYFFGGLDVEHEWNYLNGLPGPKDYEHSAKLKAVWAREMDRSIGEYRERFEEYFRNHVWK